MIALLYAIAIPSLYGFILFLTFLILDRMYKIPDDLRFCSSQEIFFVFIGLLIPVGNVIISALLTMNMICLISYFINTHQSIEEKYKYLTENCEESSF